MEIAVILGELVHPKVRKRRILSGNRRCALRL